MIGVLARPSEWDVVTEFFQLFKTPWEFYREDGSYDILLCTVSQFPDRGVKLTLVYGSEPLSFDLLRGLGAVQKEGNGRVLCKGKPLPLYGRCLTFGSHGVAGVADEATGAPVVAVLAGSDGSTVVRLGIDLFEEVRFLLTAGQPAANAAVPTLELHIALLRDLITGCAIPLVEIPPIPDSYNFIGCLTHDVDHARMRNHRCDATMLGFIYRAVVGSVLRLCRGRASPGVVCRNWLAALKLPLVHLGVAKDFWAGFDRYLELEGGVGSTFFVLPRKDYPGRTASAPAPALRASGYDVDDVSQNIQKILAAGGEVGLHGIDAWRDSSQGREEMQRIVKVTGAQEVGVRMHWLYFDEQSAMRLEEAGFSYDSTFGYNQTVGYRAGTTQVYKPLGATRIMELPLHIMDTALLYPSHLNLSFSEAVKRASAVAECAGRFGGALTLNWHDRSIAPERQWGDVYLSLLDQLREQGAWLTTAGRTVAWFRMRRSAEFRMTRKNGACEVQAVAKVPGSFPALKLRLHQPGPESVAGSKRLGRAATFRDFPFREEVSVSTAC